MHSSNRNWFGFFYTNLSKLWIISPWRMHSYICILFAKLMPLLNLFNHFLFTIFFWKFIVVNLCNTFNNYRTIIFESIKCYLFSFLKSSSKVYTWSNPSFFRYFESTLDNHIRVLLFCTVIKNCTFGAVSWKMIRILILTNSTVMFWMSLYTLSYSAHPLKKV